MTEEEKSKFFWVANNQYPKYFKLKKTLEKLETLIAANPLAFSHWVWHFLH